jgi:hypothetical protein
MRYTENRAGALRHLREGERSVTRDHSGDLPDNRSIVALVSSGNTPIATYHASSEEPSLTATLLCRIIAR